MEMLSIFRSIFTRLHIFVLFTYLTTLSLLPRLASGALQNVTVDDQDFSRFTYTPASEWSHDPLIGYDSFFYNASRSYTWTPTASVSFTFIGSGIYLQGPYAPDQADREITLDGESIGRISALAPDRQPSVVFWGRSGLEYKSHTVVATHADTASPSTIFAIDCFIAEYDDSIASSPWSSPTNTVSGTVATASNTGGSSTATHGHSGSGDNSDDNGGNNSNNGGGGSKNKTAIIVGVAVPVAFLAIGIFILLLFLYRLRRARTQSGAFGEKPSKGKGKHAGQMPFNIPTSPLPYNQPPGDGSTVYANLPNNTTAVPWANENGVAHANNISPFPQNGWANTTVASHGEPVNRFSTIGIPLNHQPIATAQAGTDEGFGDEKAGRGLDSNMSRSDDGDASWRQSTTTSTTKSPTTAGMDGLLYTGTTLTTPSPRSQETQNLLDVPRDEKRARESVGGSTTRGRSIRKEDARNSGQTLARGGTMSSSNPRRTPSRSGTPVSIWSASDTMSPGLSALPPPYSAVPNTTMTIQRGQSSRSIHQTLGDRTPGDREAEYNEHSPWSG